MVVYFERLAFPKTILDWDYTHPPAHADRGIVFQPDRIYGGRAKCRKLFCIAGMP